VLAAEPDTLLEQTLVQVCAPSLLQRERGRCDEQPPLRILPPVEREGEGDVMSKLLSARREVALGENERHRLKREREGVLNNLVQTGTGLKRGERGQSRRG